MNEKVGHPMSNDASRAAFEAWYASDATRQGIPITQEEVAELRDQSGYGDKRVMLNGKWECWQASRKAALEDAAKVCERMSIEYRDLYKGRTDPVQKDHYYNPHTDALSDGCARCEDAIKELK